MGARGPVPNRTSDLSRERDADRGDRIPVTKGELRAVFKPAADPDWHPLVKGAWDALGLSGQEDFYQSTDWAYAKIVLSELNAYLRPGIDKTASEKASKEAGHDVVVRYPERKLSGVTFAAIISALGVLGMTEGDRRRMRIELEEPKSDDKSAEVAAIADYRADLGLA